MSDSEVIKVFEILAEKNPSPQIELNYFNPFTLLVAVLLSAQATDKGVNKVTDKLFSVAKTPQDFLELGLDGLKDYIKSINYFNNKAKNIIATSQILVEKYQGEVPEDFDSLVALPGLGRKSANVLLNVLKNEGRIAVDTHLFRVSNRLGLCESSKPYDTEKALVSLLGRLLPEKILPKVHHWLVLLGRYTCKARKPLCNSCDLANLCLKKI